MTEKAVRHRHPSFALLNFSRAQCSGNVSLFGSSIKHRNIILLRISPGYLYRDLSNDSFFPEPKSFIEVAMSETQFAEAITSFNTGSGVPVTLKRFNGKDIEECPVFNKVQEFNQEFKGEMEEIGSKLNNCSKEVGELLGKKVSGKLRKEILEKIEGIARTIDNTLPFINEQFAEQMDKTKLEAKGEIESFFQNKIKSAGIKKLKGQELLEIGFEGKEEAAP